MVDAIVRTLFRLVHPASAMLEWVTAAQASATPRLSTAASLVAQIVASAVFAIAVGVLLAFRAHGRPGRSRAVPGAVGALALRRALGEPAAAGTDRISRSSPADTRSLRLVARRTWRFFETLRHGGGQFAAARQFPGEPGSRRRAPHLADQYRALSPVRASRRAISAGSARSRPSSGWRRRSRHWTSSSASAAISTTGTTPSDLRPLEPKYISSVDSGNLAGHLIALANACAEMHGARPSSVRPGARASLTMLGLRARGGAGDRELAPAPSSAASARRCFRRASRAAPTSRRRLETLDATQARTAIRQRASFCRDPRVERRSADDIASHQRRLRELTCARPARDQCALDRRRVAGAGDELLLPPPRQTLADASQRSMAIAMEFGFLFDEDRQLLSIGYRGSDGTLDAKLLRSARLRGAARQLHRHRQGRRARQALVPSRPHADAAAPAARR